MAQVVEYIIRKFRYQERASDMGRRCKQRAGIS